MYTTCLIGDSLPAGGHSTCERRMLASGRHGSTENRLNWSLTETVFVYALATFEDTGRSMALTVPLVAVPLAPTLPFAPSPGPPPFALATQIRYRFAVPVPASA